MANNIKLLKKHLKNDIYFNLINFGFKPSFYGSIPLEIKINETFIYKNCYVYARISKAGNEVFIINKDISLVLEDIKTPSFKIRTHMDLINLLKKKITNEQQYYDKLFTFGCAFGYPISSVINFSKECGKIKVRRRSDRQFISSRLLDEIIIVGYTKDSIGMRETKKSIQYFRDMAKIIINKE